MNEVIEKYRKIVLQIATPHSTGTGFYLSGAGVIVTSELIVRGNREVIIEGAMIKKQLAKVLFTDAKYGLALLHAPVANVEMPVLNTRHPEPGAVIYAAGYPFGLQFSVSSGRVIPAGSLNGGINCIGHDAPLESGICGGPLLNESGEIVGVNTFFENNPGGAACSLPASCLLEVLEAFEKMNQVEGTRCLVCEKLVFKSALIKNACPYCGAGVLLPSRAPVYEPKGIACTVEEILSECGHDNCLARKGKHIWEVQEGSAKIIISYYEPKGFLTGDAFLCELPSGKLDEVYEFLLRQNHEIENLSLSVKDREVVLSLVIYDRHLNLETGMKMFRDLFEKADYYDNILVEQYGAHFKYPV